MSLSIPLKEALKCLLFTSVIILAFTSKTLYQLMDNSVIVVEQENISILRQNQFLTENDDTIDQRCNLFSGKWVYDNVSYPLYKEGQCGFMEDTFACEANGRNNLKYQNWRWQPHECDLPRFHGATLLEKLRHKKMMFVGDSVNRNQWRSLLCLIEPYISPSKIYREGNSLGLHVKEYNATIASYWSPYLVESNGDDPINHKTRDRIVRIASIEKHAIHWSDADILIFDAFMWWHQTMTLLWGSFGSSDAVYKRVENKLRRYEMGLNTWSDWLEFNINRTKTKLFFMSISPFHSYGDVSSDDGTGTYCYNATEPILKDGYRGLTTSQEMMKVVESVLHKLETRGLNFMYLNITQLSDYRKDGHPSVYRPSLELTKEQRLNPLSSLDCTHWCLPGVPDVWNQILYSYIINS